jgi:restriction system protein
MVPTINTGVRRDTYDLAVRATKLFALSGVIAVTGGYALGAGPWWSIAAGICFPVATALLPRFLAGVVTGVLTPSAREDAAGRARAMSGTEFEDYIARVARACGLPVRMTAPSGDWGVDLVVGRFPDRLAVQCKRTSRPIGPSAIQEVVAGAPMHGCTRTMVVTNHEFTVVACRLAELHGCRLVGGSQLPQLRSLIHRAATEAVS